MADATLAARVMRLQEQISKLSARITDTEAEKTSLDALIQTIEGAVVPPFLVYLSPPGIVDEEYPDSGHIRINSEIMRYSRIAGTDTLAVQVNQRGRFGTQVSTHDKGDSVQLCLAYEDARVDRIMRELLVDYGDIEASLIDDAGWNDEASCWLLGHVVSGVVSEPTGVTTLLGELSFIGPYIWWDERSQKIRLRAQRPELPSDVAATITDDNAILPNGQIKDLIEDRLSQIYLYFDQVDAAQSLSDIKNYHRLIAHLTPDAERANEYGDRKIARSFTRWLDIEREHLAKYVAGQVALRTRYTPVEMDIPVDVSRRETWVGDVVRIESALDQDPSGAPLSSLWSILSAEEDRRGDRVRYRMRRSDYSRLASESDGRFAFVAVDGTTDYDMSSPNVLASASSWIATDNGNMPDGTPGWIIV